MATPESTLEDYIVQITNTVGVGLGRITHKGKVEELGREIMRLRDDRDDMKRKLSQSEIVVRAFEYLATTAGCTSRHVADELKVVSGGVLEDASHGATPKMWALKVCKHCGVVFMPGTPS